MSKIYTMSWHQSECHMSHKEALRTWYATTSATRAAPDLDRWIVSVKRQGPTEMRKALSAFRNWRQEILAFFD